MANSLCAIPLKLIALLAFVLALQACNRKEPSDSKANAVQNSAPNPNPARPSAAQAEGPRDVEDEIVLAVSKAVRTYRLTNLPDACLAYRFYSNDSASAYTVDVMENHRHPECGGDRQTQPRLFTIEVDKPTRQMATDRGSPGKFHPIGSAQP